MPQMLRGEQHGRWLGGVREKVCEFCGSVFQHRRGAPYATFRRQKFCSWLCGVKGRTNRTGADHPNWNPNARRKNRGGSHRKWRDAVISRDGGRCVRCGVEKVELHAHHLKPYKDYPELRFDVANGETLCYKCHWLEHTALTAKAVKSGNTLPEQSEGNPEPSERGNLLEGVTTRGRAYRRWVGTCDWCKTTISKALSDTKGKMALFCGKRCMGKWCATRRGFNVGNGSNASTSAAPERDDIV